MGRLRLNFLKSLKFKKKKAGAFGCYGWSGESVQILREKLTEAGFAVVEGQVRSSWNPDEEDDAKISEMVSQLLA